jgi:hypothetical protein
VGLNETTTHLTVETSPSGGWNHRIRPWFLHYVTTRVIEDVSELFAAALLFAACHSVEIGTCGMYVLVIIFHKTGCDKVISRLLLFMYL